MKGRRGRRSKQLLDDLEGKMRLLEIESGSIRSHSVENWPWKRQWTCPATDYRMNERRRNNVGEVKRATIFMLNAYECHTFNPWTRPRRILLSQLHTTYERCTQFWEAQKECDRLCGLVVRVSDYRYRGLGFDSRRYQIFWVAVGLERGALSLVRSIEELLE